MTENSETRTVAATVKVREVTTTDEFDACIRLQREAFALPDLEISPRRHLIVSREAGGWTLGAFAEERLVGFVHHLQAAHGNVITGYSHMMAVAVDFQNRGVGAQLKWAQRVRTLQEGRDLIRWTWEPMRPRNAHFNLNRLGAVVRAYAVNFYGTDYGINPGEIEPGHKGMTSDRLFASWELLSPRVRALAEGREYSLPEPTAVVEIPSDYPDLLKSDSDTARAEQARVRDEFLAALSSGLVCRAFDRQSPRPRYLLYREDQS